MAAAPRIRIEANADVSHCLSQIRQAYHLHAQQQLAPGRIPDLWTTLHRTHYTHGWRMHASQSGQPGWKPPTLGTEDDPRDFVPFLRRQLAPDELAFALFVVFQGHRTSMRDDAGAEVKRRYNALRGNVGNFSEDDIMFELGPEVLRSTPALRTLNSLLNPRETAALRFHPVAVFRAVRAEMLERHHDAVNPPSVLPIDVNRAALHTPRTPIRAEPLPSGAVSSPADFRTPPQGPLVLPAEARPVVREELERWREIVRLVQAMPEPTGNSLWVETVRAATQSMRPVSLWVENMLDEDALRDDTAQ
nr:uncharacterized protein CTRU02_13674 [Colletotrichum truncatum]KAF6783022.1 hypothetical protein CTRU02_13674 [Colletotrichum truncatum]